MGGSGGGGGGSKQAAPPQAQPIDYGKMMEAAAAASERQVEAQYKNLVKYYPDMERQQLGSVQNIATLLSPEGGGMRTWVKDANGNWTQQDIGTAAPNVYTAEARQAALDALGQRGAIEGQAGNLGDIGNWIMDRARESYIGSAPTTIEAELRRQAEGDLALGRQLSPEEQRDAVQSARAAMQARGLATGQGSVAAEILNRDAAAQARESARRNFAASTNQMVEGNIMARRDQAAQQAALGSNVLGNSASLSNMSANLGLAGGQALIGIDPVARAIDPGLKMGGGIQSTGAQMIGNTYVNSARLAGDVAGFNANMLDSRYNSYQNNQAALQSARMQAGAANNSATMGLVGAGVGAAAGIAVIAI